ncbi:CRISPR-associated endonuclease Cas2 [Vibrio alfacsensis]|uniref:CRISPR-associated endoribonuclease Cas2 n=1 Tax=Vibrio alfacsensis TaxID=1074311 RepID=A0ABM6YTF7_9VIBR|nr:CRISPR-associated endonuclease Cas2 [Vibrio alfacsensis]AXY00912.1 CRISPR-associated endonuclease Cas2 [Vibrio alfacsensis]
MRHIFLVCYDISDNKTRRYVEKALLNHGVRVQYSVFECMLTLQQLHRLRYSLRQKIDPITDAVHYFHLCKHCKAKRFAQGSGQIHTYKSYELV